MSARSRPRANHNQEADEERRLWREIKAKANEIDVHVNRSNTIGNLILEAEIQQAELINADKPTDPAIDKTLEDLYRENVRLCEEVQSMSSGTTSDMNILDSIGILAGLREASSAELAAAPAPRDRVASSKSARDRPKKNGSKVSSAAATEDGVDDVSAAPSPRISLGTSNRLTVKDKSSRAGSIPVTREPSVKIEDGVESVASSADTALSSKADAQAPSSASRLGNRVNFQKGDEVFYRHKDKTLEGEGILCRVTAVIGDGKQRRYEIQDVDTDISANPPAPGGGKAPSVAASTGGGSGSSFRASISSLMQIPVSNDRLGDLSKGRQVLALYPETTTFYRGEISAAWRAKESGLQVRVKFEGETDDVSQPVERRFVMADR